MKIAIPVHNERVSPVLDTARNLTVYSIGQKNSFTCSNSIDLGGTNPYSLVDTINKSGIELIICGGLSRELASLIQSSGVELIPWISGAISDVVEAYCDGCINNAEFRMPGCRKQNRRRCRCSGRTSDIRRN